VTSDGVAFHVIITAKTGGIPPDVEVGLSIIKHTEHSASIAPLQAAPKIKLTKASNVWSVDFIASPMLLKRDDIFFVFTVHEPKRNQHTQRSDRVCGIHFFNPAPAMKLVEVVRPLTASDDTIAAAMSFATTCGKDAVEVADRAGFVVNALLFPYLNNAVRMLENGTATRDDIDTAMKGGCNFPMGPLALLDLVGLDTSLAILDALYDEFRDPNYAAVPALRRMVSAGQLGRKTGLGFYDYAKK
jgi:hypothetical protein